jgi:NAD(P)-dependent dehydrogenase (short-subunit alcohol dehydrogenase family)
MTLSPSPARRFAGSVTVITGAGSGIGRALALALGRRGALMVCTDVDATSATETRDLVAAAGAVDVKSNETVGLRLVGLVLAG